MRRSLTVSEARIRLPQLLREIARGGGPFYIGPRGEAVAVLSSVAARDEHGAGMTSEGLAAWEAASVELPNPETLEDDIKAIRREMVESTIAKWDRLAGEAGQSRPSGRKKSTRPRSRR